VLGLKPEDVWAAGKYTTGCGGAEFTVLLGSEGTGCADVFPGAKTWDIDSVCQ
jgi:hypothetical protein